MNLFKDRIIDGNYNDLINYNQTGKGSYDGCSDTRSLSSFALCAGIEERKMKHVSFFNDKAVMGSLSMTSVRIG